MRDPRIADQLSTLSGDGWTPEDYSQRVRIREDRILILGDAHVPYHDPELLTEALTEARVSQVEAIVWLGDLMDMPTFSSWGQEDMTTLYTRELDMVRRIIELASTIVPKQYWSSGNHEMRFMRRNSYHFGMQQLAMMAGLSPLMADGRLVVSDNPTLDYGPAGASGKRAWMLTHPATYGGQPLVVPGRVADRYQANVISAHAHHWAMGKSPSGRFTVVESGGLFKPESIKYVQHRITTNRAWTQGYVLLEHGRATLCGPNY